MLTLHTSWQAFGLAKVDSGFKDNNALQLARLPYSPIFFICGMGGGPVRVAVVPTHGRAIQKARYERGPLGPCGMKINMVHTGGIREFEGDSGTDDTAALAHLRGPPILPIAHRVLSGYSVDTQRLLSGYSAVQSAPLVPGPVCSRIPPIMTTQAR